MLSEKQLKYLRMMPEERLLSYINDQDYQELERLKINIKKAVQSGNSIDKVARDSLLTILSYVEAKLVGSIQDQSKIEEWIDISDFKPLTSSDLIEILGLTIKKDNENKIITFLCMISAYAHDSQFNLSFNAPSSSGKSFIPTEIADLFPKEDVLEVGYCSPTAFFHDSAKNYDKGKNELVVDFTGKIIIFLDQPHTLLLQHLRPLLSHDKREIRIKITDKSQKAGLRTKNVLLRGFPAVIFCTAGLSIDEQESTRFILLSPEINQEKIRESIQEKIKRSSDNYAYKYSLETNSLREMLKKRIKAIKQEGVPEVIINNPKKIEELFFERVKILKPRHQRDVGRVMSIIKVLALLNVWFRERDASSVIVSDEDIHEGFKLYDTISESQELNLPPYVYDLYKRVVLPAYQEKNPDGIEIGTQGNKIQEFMKKHHEVYGRFIPLWQLRQDILPMLETAGLITQEPDQNNKRVLLIYPTTQLTIPEEQQYSEVNGGVQITS